MAQRSEVLDGVFTALSDPTRRAVIARLGQGPTTVGDLARDVPMTLPSFMKHLRLLEAHGLIRSTKSGRVRTCELDPARLSVVQSWLDEQRQVWHERTDRLAALVADPGPPTDPPTGPPTEETP